LKFKLILGDNKKVNKKVDLILFVKILLNSIDRTFQTNLLEGNILDLTIFKNIALFTIFNKFNYFSND